MNEKLTLKAGNNITLRQIDNDLEVSSDVDLTDYYTKAETNSAIDDAINNVLTEYELYNQTNGGNNTITLNDNVENYKYIEVFYGLQYSAGMSSVKVYNPSSKSINLISGAIVQNTNTIYIRTARITFEQTTGTFTLFGRFTWGAVNSVTSDTNEIYIYRVVGYK